MKIAIMTDTNSGMTAAEAQRAGVFLLPMPVIIDETCYLEGVDIQSGQFYEAMKQERKISTSQPSPGSMTDMWDSILQAGFDQILYIPMTSGLSGSCQSAMLLAQEYGEKVLVADNHRISVPLLESVLEAKEMADSGCSAREIKEHLEETAFQASIYLTVSSLKYLRMGGRLSPSAAMLGTLLNIKPVLSIQGGQIDVVDKVRGLKTCEKKMVEAIEADIASRFADVPADKLLVATAGTLQSSEDVDHWLSVVQDAFPSGPFAYAPLPCSIATHVGPDCMAIGVMVTGRKNRQL